jgi:hypothetical protein
VCSVHEQLSTMCTLSRTRKLVERDHWMWNNLLCSWYRVTSWLFSGTITIHKWKPPETVVRPVDLVTCCKMIVVQNEKAIFLCLLWISNIRIEIEVVTSLQKIVKYIAFVFNLIYHNKTHPVRMGFRIATSGCVFLFELYNILGKYRCLQSSSGPTGTTINGVGMIRFVIFNATPFNQLRLHAAYFMRLIWRVIVARRRCDRKGHNV